MNGADAFIARPQRPELREHLCQIEPMQNPGFGMQEPGTLHRAGQAETGQFRGA